MKTLKEMFEEYPDYNWITQDKEPIMWTHEPYLDEVLFDCNGKMEYINEHSDCKLLLWATEFDMPKIDWGDLKNFNERCVSREEINN